MKNNRFVRLAFLAMLVLGGSIGAFGQSIYRIGVLWNDTLLAGDTIPLKAFVIDQRGDTISDTAVINKLSWRIDPASIDPSDKIFSVTPDSVLLTGERFRTVQILITLNNTLPLVDTSITILIVAPGPDHVVIEPAGTPLPNNDNPIGTITIGPTQTSVKVYAVLRDRFQNFAKYSQTTLWSSDMPNVVSVPAKGGGNAAIGEGVITAVGTGTALVVAMDSASGFKDSCTVTVNIIPGSPMSISIYNSELPPGPGVEKIPDPTRSIMVPMGTPYLLVAKVFDRNNVWLSQYQLSGMRDSITWSASARSGNITKNFDTLKGAVCHFTPTLGYDTVTVVVTFRPDSLTIVTDTVSFLVFNCCPFQRLVIEPKGTIDWTRLNELDTLLFLPNELQRSVYTTLRDTFGNLIRYGNIARWVSHDTSIVKVEKGNAAFGEGIVSRNNTTLDSVVGIYAIDTGGAVSDTCWVKLVKLGYYCKLRIAAGNDTNPPVLEMPVNSDTLVNVQGHRNTDGSWIAVSANWTCSANLQIDPPALNNHTCRFTGKDTGMGWIRVSTDGLCAPDSLPVSVIDGSQSIRNETAGSWPSDKWKIAALGGFARLHIPLHGTHLINVYSLSGSIIYSSRTSVNDAQIKLPGGVLIISVQTIGSAERFTAKVFIR